MLLCSSPKEDEINPGHYNPIPEVSADVFGMPPMVCVFQVLPACFSSAVVVFDETLVRGPPHRNNKIYSSGCYGNFKNSDIASQDLRCHYRFLILVPGLISGRKWPSEQDIGLNIRLKV